MATIEKLPIKYSNIEICRNCKGNGVELYDGPPFTNPELDPYKVGDVCHVCRGGGRVKITKEIKITIETV